MEDAISKRCLSTEDIYDIIDGEASEETAAKFAEHIKNCNECRREYENIKMLKKALRDQTSEPSPDFAKNTLARIKKVERNPFIRITGSRTFKTVTAVAACLILVFIVCGHGIINAMGDNVTHEKEDTRISTVSADNEYAIGENEEINASLFSVYTEKENSDGLRSDDEIVVDESDSTVADDVDTKSFEITVSPVAPQAPENNSIELPEDPVPVIEEAFTEEPTAGNSVAIEPTEEYTSKSDSGGDCAPAVENPIACDSFSNDPETPDYICIPTDLLEKVTVNSALYDNETTIVNITDINGENSIYFIVYEAESAISQYKAIQTNYANEPVIDGVYVIDPENGEYFTMYWFAEESFYKLVLPIEYRDGNETRFTAITEIENPAK